MGLTAPNLDDRGFQDLVDEAKRLIQQRCPEWTDHNVSDPGVTLIEAFAGMVDQLIYRLNRVPERNYVKFLDLIGVQRRPPSAARGTATFWLSAPRPHDVLVRAATEIATPRTDVQEAIVFSTTEDLTIVPCAFSRAASFPSGGEPVEKTAALAGGAGFACFSPAPRVGDALLVGLTNAVPSCAVVLRLDCRVSGVGVDPRNPPLIWEAWTSGGWVGCELDRDETGGLNRPGDVVLHVPADHQPSIIAAVRAGWLRCRLLEPEPEQRTYSESPTVRALSAFTMGGTARTMHAEVVGEEEIGISDGAAAQRFSLGRGPVVPWEEPAALSVLDGAGVTTWRQVEHFAESGPCDQVFQLEPITAEVRFGPAIRQADGSLRYYGAVPPKGAHLRLTAYRTGGGSAGNLAPGKIHVLKTSNPDISRVQNRHPAVGGVDAESLEDAKVRGPLMLRSRSRAVTADDFVQLSAQVAPEVARIHCVATDTGADAGGVRLLLVPGVQRDATGRIRREDLQPQRESLTRITEHLAERKMIGTRLVVEPPDYRWLTAVVSVTARPRFRSEDVRAEVLQALYRLFDPLLGGSDGNGWPFGRAVQAGEINAALSQVRGVDLAEDMSIRLFPADPATGRRGAETQRLALDPNCLVYSFEHQVRVRS